MLKILHIEGDRDRSRFGNWIGEVSCQDPWGMIAALSAGTARPCFRYSTVTAPQDCATEERDNKVSRSTHNSFHIDERRENGYARCLPPEGDNGLRYTSEPKLNLAD